LIFESANEEINLMCNTIEKLTIKSLKLTNDTKTIDLIYSNYIKTIKYQKQQNLYKLGESIEFLETKIKLQKVAIDSNKKKERNLNFKKRIKRAVFTGIALFICFGGLYLFIKIKTSEAIIETNEVQIETIKQVDSLITVFCNENDTVLTVYRKQIYIPKKIALPEDISKVKQQISYYAKFRN